MSQRVPPSALPSTWLACLKETSREGCYATYIVIRAMDDTGSLDKFRVHSASWQDDNPDPKNHQWCYHHGDYVKTWETALKCFSERANLQSAISKS